MEIYPLVILESKGLSLKCLLIQGFRRGGGTLLNYDSFLLSNFAVKTFFHANPVFTPQGASHHISSTEVRPARISQDVECKDSLSRLDDIPPC